MAERGGLQYTIEVVNQFEGELRQFNRLLATSENRLEELEEAQDANTAAGRRAIAVQRRRNALLRRQVALTQRSRNSSRLLLARQRQANRVVRQGSRALATYNNRLRGLNVASASSLRGIRALITGFVALEFAQSAVTAALAPLREALDLQSTLETAQIGIRSILIAARGSRGLGIGEAANIADVALQRIQEEAARTSVTVQELTEATQVGFGVGLEAGLGLEQIIQISRGVSQATQAITGDTSQIQSELRALFGQGNVRNAQVAQAIEGALRVQAELRGIRVQGDGLQELLIALRQSGQLGDVLVEALAPFNQAGDEIAQTLAGIGSNLRDNFQIAAVQAFRPLLQLLRELGLELNEFLRSAQASELLGTFGETVIASIDAVLTRLQAAFGGGQLQSDFDQLSGAIVAAVGVVTDVVIGVVQGFRDVLPIVERVGTVISQTFGVDNLGSFVQGLVRAVTVFTLIAGAVSAVRGALIGIRTAVFALSGPLGATLILATGLALAFDELKRNLEAVTGGPLDDLQALQLAFVEIRQRAIEVGIGILQFLNLAIGGIALLLTRAQQGLVSLLAGGLRGLVILIQRTIRFAGESIARTLETIPAGLIALADFIAQLVAQSIRVLIQGIAAGLQLVIRGAFGVVEGQLRALANIPLFGAPFAEAADFVAQKTTEAVESINTVAAAGSAAVNDAANNAGDAADNLQAKIREATTAIREATDQPFEDQAERLNEILQQAEAGFKAIADNTGAGLKEREEALNRLAAEAQQAFDRTQIAIQRDALERAAERAQAAADAEEAVRQAEERLQRAREDAERSLARTEPEQVPPEIAAAEKAFDDFETRLANLSNVTTNTLNFITQAVQRTAATISSALIGAFLDPQQDIRQAFGNLLRGLAQQLLTIIIQALIAKAIVAAIGTSTPAGAAITSARTLAQQFAFGAVSGAGGAGGLAAGGQVPGGHGVPAGSRPRGLPSTDTTPAWLTPGEWVQPVSAVAAYGQRFMRAVQTLSIDPSEARAMAARASVRRVSSRRTGGYQTGGEVAAATAGVAQGPSLAVVVPNQSAAANLFAQGDRAFLRFVRSNRDQIKAALG